MRVKTHASSTTVQYNVAFDWSVHLLHGLHCTSQ